MIIRSSAVFFAAWTTFASGQPVIGDIRCDDSARLSRSLEQVLGAERQGFGLRDPETTLEVWVARDSGDWVILQNYANGTSCIVATGEHWEGIRPEPA